MTAAEADSESREFYNVAQLIKLYHDSAVLTFSTNQRRNKHCAQRVNTDSIDRQHRTIAQLTKLNPSIALLTYPTNQRSKKPACSVYFVSD